MNLRLLALGFSCMLGACTTTPPVPQDPEKLRATHGLVVAVAPGGWNREPAAVTLNARGSGQLYPLQGTAASPRVFATWVPAGTYDLVGWSARGDQTPTPIQVVAGEATDLGGIRWFDVGGYEHVLLAFSHPELSALSKREIEIRRAHLGREAIEWRPMTVPSPQQIPRKSTNLGLIVDLMASYERSLNKPSVKKQLKDAKSVDDFLRLARSAVVPTLNEPYRDAGGALYFAADFGQIRVRNTAGQWSSIDTGTTDPITSVYGAGERVFAGSRGGQIRVRSKPGAPWELLRRMSPREAVVDIETASGRWFVITVEAQPGSTAAVAETQRVLVYAGEKDDLSDLRLYRSFDYKATVLYQDLGVRGEYYRGHYYVNAVTSLVRLNVRSMAWEDLNPGHAVSHFRISQQSGTLTAFAAGGAFSKLSVSSDGAGFKRVTTPPYPVADIYFSNASSATAVRWSTGMFESQMQFLRFDPAASAWPLVAEADPATCVKSLRTPDGQDNFCVSRSGSILRLNGKEFTVEFAAD